MYVNRLRFLLVITVLIAQAFHTNAYYSGKGVIVLCQPFQLKRLQVQSQCQGPTEPSSSAIVEASGHDFIENLNSSIWSLR